MPQRETVAGEATSRFSTSKRKVHVCVNLIRLRLGKHSVFESSSTVLSDSIHSVSTGLDKAHSSGVQQARGPFV